MDVPYRSDDLSLSQSGIWDVPGVDDNEQAKDLPRLETIEKLKRLPEYIKIKKGEVRSALSNRIKGTCLLRGTKYENLFDLNFVQEHGEIERVRVMVGERGIIHCGTQCWNSPQSFLLWNLLFTSNAFIPNLDLAEAEQKLNGLNEKGIKGFLFRLDPSDDSAFILSYATGDGVQHVRFNYNSQKSTIENPAVQKLQYNTIDELIHDYINENQFPIHRSGTKVKIEGLDVESPVNEYKTIKQIKKSTFDFLTAEAKNKKGNRYTDVLPYNENRIKLNSGQYINASRVTVPDGGTYICTQGPIQEYNNHTSDEFWEMVWQEDVPVIVMVTDLQEGAKEKCAKYWPECGYRRVKFGNVGVECVSEQIRYAGSASKEEEGLTLRTFRLTNGNDTKIVHQLKYEKWVDQGIANLDLVSKMIDDTNMLRSDLKAMDKPILVHCSAGIGRTGTFVAEHHLSFTIDKALSEGIVPTINVRSTVIQLRNGSSGRVNMVQNENQYQHIYSTLRNRYKGNL